MKDEKIFLSYSRNDSAFALDLAVKLKEAGANLWIDQLDILPGARWDTEVGKALEDAECVLVILSCTSVSSNNVLDEVSYALEANKRVVPVLVDDCVIPFRLRRLQYISFANNHNDAFNRLVKALKAEGVMKPEAQSQQSETSLSTPVVEQKTAQQFTDTPIQKNQFSNEREEASKPNETKVRKSRRNKIILIISSVVVIIAVVAVLNFKGSSKKEALQTGSNDSSLAMKNNATSTKELSTVKTKPVKSNEIKMISSGTTLPSRVNKGNFIFHTGSDGRERGEVFLSLFQAEKLIWRTRVIVEKPWDPFSNFVYNSDVNTGITPSVPLVLKLALCSPHGEDISWSGDVIFTLQTDKSPLTYKGNFVLNTANSDKSNKCNAVEIPQVK